MKQEFTRESKLELFGDGPWVDEPDRVEWRHEGLPCLVRRVPVGVFCGYVAVPWPHPWYALAADDCPASAHGGLNYSGECVGDICHVPRPGEPDRVWWLGFDCGHAGDRLPLIDRDWQESDESRRLFADWRYRGVEYVRREVCDLAEQVAAEPAWCEYLERVDRARTESQLARAAVYIGLAQRRMHRRLPHAEARARRMRDARRTMRARYGV
jgi:hypothetical protein